MTNQIIALKSVGIGKPIIIAKQTTMPKIGTNGTNGVLKFLFN